MNVNLMGLFAAAPVVQDNVPAAVAGSGLAAANGPLALVSAGTSSPFAELLGGITLAPPSTGSTNAVIEAAPPAPPAGSPLGSTALRTTMFTQTDFAAATAPATIPQTPPAEVLPAAVRAEAAAIAAPASAPDPAKPRLVEQAATAAPPAEAAQPLEADPATGMPIATAQTPKPAAAASPAQPQVAQAALVTAPAEARASTRSRETAPAHVRRVAPTAQQPDEAIVGGGDPVGRAPSPSTPIISLAPGGADQPQREQPADWTPPATEEVQVAPATPVPGAPPLQTAATAAEPTPGKPQDVPANPGAANDARPVIADAAAKHLPEPAPAGERTAAAFEPVADPAKASQPAGPAQPSGSAAQASTPSATQFSSAIPAPAPIEPRVAARPGQFGRELGIEIARRVGSGGDELLVRLNPQDMGRISVRMSFDEGGSLRAVVTAENPAALDMLRREAGDLGRALADAGVRADSQSLKFDTRSDGGAFSNRQQSEGGRGGQSERDPRTFTAEAEEPAYRQHRSAGQIDLMA
jgi:flagellar hook-length control protein FliK